MIPKWHLTNGTVATQSGSVYRWIESFLSLKREFWNKFDRIILYGTSWRLCIYLRVTCCVRTHECTPSEQHLRTLPQCAPIRHMREMSNLPIEIRRMRAFARARILRTLSMSAWRGLHMGFPVWCGGVESVVPFSSSTSLHTHTHTHTHQVRVANSTYIRVSTHSAPAHPRTCASLSPLQV